MTYQPVYGKVSDEFVERTTSSRWGKVNRIDFDGLTHFGTGISVSLISDGKLPKKDVREAERKILEWAERGKNTRMEQWAKKLRERKLFNTQQEDIEKVDIDINITDNPKMNYMINGIKITHKMLSIIKNNEEFLNKLEVANNLENE